MHMSTVCLCRESVAINSSLMTLARCLEVLRYNQQHPADQKVIPYRESKVTCPPYGVACSCAQSARSAVLFVKGEAKVAAGQLCVNVVLDTQAIQCSSEPCPVSSLQITHLFKGVLHGNGRFVMVVNVSPASEEFNETKRVLQVSQQHASPACWPPSRDTAGGTNTHLGCLSTGSSCATHNECSAQFRT